MNIKNKTRFCPISLRKKILTFFIFLNETKDDYFTFFHRISFHFLQLVVLFLFDLPTSFSGDIAKHRKKMQSTRNSFEPRRTFCPANLESFAGHLEFSPDVSLWYVWRISNFSLDILSGEIKLLRWTFPKFAGHVRQVRQISHTLKMERPYPYIFLFVKPSNSLYHS